MIARKKTCRILGMCFATDIAYLLRLSEEFRQRYTVVAYATGGGRNYIADFEISDEELHGTEAVIYHTPDWAGWGDKEGYKSYIARFPDRLLKVTYPYPTFQPLWPYHAHDKRKDDIYDSHDEENSLLFAYADHQVLSMRRKGMSPAEIVAQYALVDIPSMINLEQMFDHIIDEQTEKEKDTDVKVVDFLAGNFKNMQVMFCINHAANALLLHMTNQILVKLDCATIDPEHLSALVQMRDPAVPIHPSILKYYDIRWTNEKARYRLDKRRNLTWEQYIFALASDYLPQHAHDEA